MVFAIVTSSAVFTNAVSTIDVGEYTFAVHGSGEYMIYRYNGSDTELGLPDKVYDLPVVGVYSNCFAESNIVSVEMPDSYTIIGESAFLNCAELESVNIPSGLTSLGDFAFAGCKSLNTTDFSGTELEKLPDAAFMGDEELSLVIFPDKCNTIGDFCFSGCSSLSNISLPRGITNIGERAFYKNSSLAELYLPKSVVSVGESAFSPMAENGDIKMVALENTYANQYIDESGYIDKSIVLLGDFNLSGKLNVNDATSIQKYIVNLHSVLPQALEAGDVNNDGNISVRDATLIQMRIAEIISSFD